MDRDGWTTCLRSQSAWATRSRKRPAILGWPWPRPTPAGWGRLPTMARPQFASRNPSRRRSCSWSTLTCHMPGPLRNRTCSPTRSPRWTGCRPPWVSEETPTTAQIERWRARAHYAAGQWDEAMVDLDSALLVNASGIDVWPEPLALRALIRIHRGEVSAAQEDLDRFDALVAADAPVLVLDQPMLARAFLMEGGGTEAQM